MDSLNPEIIFALIFVVGAAIKALIERRSGGRLDNEEESTSVRDLYDEYREEILRRQHQHPETQLPERSSQYQVESPTSSRSILEELPAAEIEAVPPPPPPSPTPRSLSVAEKDAAARFQKATTKSHHHRAHAPSRVKELLASPSSTRDAIILSEILGKPRGV